MLKRVEIRVGVGNSNDDRLQYYRINFAPYSQHIIILSLL